jgi:hypothetical protein
MKSIFVNRKLLLKIAFLLLFVCLLWVTLGPANFSHRNLPDPRANAAHLSPRSQISFSGRPPITALPFATASHNVLRYGSDAAELGMVHGVEMEPVGPPSFAVSSDGNVLVADTAKQRVAIYAPDGTYLRSISVTGIALGDVTTDKAGRIYVFDQVRFTLHQYDADGTPRSTLALNPKDIDTRGYFHVAGAAVYFADAAVQDVLVANIEAGGLTAPDASIERKTDGIHAESGKVYSVGLVRGEALLVQVRESATDAKLLEAPVDGIVSARFAGEDRDQRFYIQTERLEGATVVLEVVTFASSGEQLGVRHLPENDYFIWTAKLVDVRSDGALVQFLPQRDQARLNYFAN